MNISNVITVSSLLCLTTIFITYLTYFIESLFYINKPNAIHEVYKKKEYWHNMMISIMCSMPFNIYILYVFKGFNAGPNSILFFVLTNMTCVFTNILFYNKIKYTTIKTVFKLNVTSFDNRHIKEEDVKYIETALKTAQNPAENFDNEDNIYALSFKDIPYGQLKECYLSGYNRKKTIISKYFEIKQIKLFKKISNIFRLKHLDNYSYIESKSIVTHPMFKILNKAYFFEDLYKINGDIPIIEMSDLETGLLEMHLI